MQWQRSAVQKETSNIAAPQSAKEAIEQGLVAFREKKTYPEAVKLFRTAMELNPTEDEAMAALYNLGELLSPGNPGWRDLSVVLVMQLRIL